MRADAYRRISAPSGNRGSCSGSGRCRSQASRCGAAPPRSCPARDPPVLDLSEGGFPAAHEVGISPHSGRVPVQLRDGGDRPFVYVRDEPGCPVELLIRRLVGTPESLFWNWWQLPPPVASRLPAPISTLAPPVCDLTYPVGVPGSVWIRGTGSTSPWPFRVVGKASPVHLHRKLGRAPPGVNRTGRTPDEAAVREVFEETGIRVELVGERRDDVQTP